MCDFTTSVRSYHKAVIFTFSISNNLVIGGGEGKESLNFQQHFDQSALAKIQKFRRVKG